MITQPFRQTNRTVLLIFGFLAVAVGYGVGIYAGLTPSLLEFGLIALSFPALIIFFARPEIGFLFLHFTNYLRISDNLRDFYGAPHFIYPLMILMILIVLARWFLTGQEPKGWAFPLMLLVAYGVVAATGIYFARDPQATQEEFMGFLRGAVITMLTIVMIQDKETFKHLISTLLVAGVILGSLSIYQYFTNTFSNNYWGLAQSSLQSIYSTSEASRIGGPTGDPNQFSQILVFLVPIGFSLTITEKNGWLRFIAIWATVVCTLSIIFSYSRGGLLALVVAMLVVLLHHRPRVVEVLLVLTIIIVILSNVPGQYTERMKTMVDLVAGRLDPREEDSIRVRTSAYIVGFKMFMDHPWLGVGMHNFPVMYPSYSREVGIDPSGKEWAPHSLYLEALSELGFLGFSIFLIILANVFRRTWMAWKTFKMLGSSTYAGLIAGVGAGLVGYFTAAIFLQNSYSRYFWSIVGIALALKQVARSAVEQSVGTQTEG